MNVVIRLLVFTVAVLVMMQLSLATEPDPEELFQQLRDKVAEELPKQTLEKRTVIDETLDRIIDCGAMGPVHPYVGMRVYNNKYTVSETFSDDKYHFCVYMVNPFTRALSIDEARDFMAASDLDLPKIGKGRVPTGVKPDDVHAFEELRATLADQLNNFTPQQIADALRGTENLQGCADMSVEELKAATVSGGLGWNYNTAYEWNKVRLANGYCIYMSYPLNRGLTLKEALDFTMAMHLDLGESPRIKSLGPEYAPSIPPQHPDSPKKKTTEGGDQKNIKPVINSFGQLTGGSYPYTTTTRVNLLDTGTVGANSSAVQVGDFVYMTAAHVLVDNAGVRLPGTLRVYPSDKLPSAVDAINAVGFDYDPAFKDESDNAHRYEHDIAFIHVNPRRHVVFPQLLPIAYAHDQGFDGYPVPCSQLTSANDPYFVQVDFLGQPVSWFNTDPACTVLEKAIVGYPNCVEADPLSNGQCPAGSTDNTRNPYPYKAAPLTLVGNSHGGRQYALYHPFGSNPATRAVIGISGAHAWKGMSGAPIFGKDLSGTWWTLGIVTNRVAPGQGYLFDGLGAGRFDYNTSWVRDELTWTPDGYSVIITSPQNNAHYLRDSVPNLRASAGPDTNLIQWRSNIDGFLGTGGNVNVGSMTLGYHNITASVSQGTHNPGRGIDSPGGAPESSFASVLIKVTGPADIPWAPSISTPQNPVVIPYGHTSKSATMTWTAACDCQNYETDIAYYLNHDPYSYTEWQNDAPAGSAPFTVRVGDYIEFYAFQHHFSPPDGNRLVVTGVQGGAPAFHVTPSIVYVEAPQTSGLFTMTWNAPGWDMLDLCSSTNGAPRVCDVEILDHGSTTQTIPVGATYQFFFTPHLQNSNVLGSLTVQSVQVPPHYFHITPAEVHIVPPAVTGDYLMSWDARAYGASLDLWGKTNSGPWQFAVEIPAAGTSSQTIPPGYTYEYRIYPHVVPPAQGTLLASATVHADGSSAPTFIVTPTTVHVAPPATTGPYTMNVNVPQYSLLDMWGKVNDGLWQFATQTPGTFTSNQTIPPGATHQYRFYPAGSPNEGGTQGLLGSLVVHGVSTATFSLAPTTVHVTPPSTAGNFSYTWNAAGYSSLDEWGKVNNGPWQFGVQIPASGTSSQTMPTNTTYHYRFYPHEVPRSLQGGQNYLLGELMVHSVSP
jgi:hypothetical protein